MAREQLQTLTEPMYYILLSLLTPKHGYGIMKQVDEISNARVKVGAGTLYALLARFEKEEIVICIDNQGNKKTYELTQKGLDILWKEFYRLKALAKAGELLLGGLKDE